MALYNVRVTPCQNLCNPLIEITNFTLSTNETVVVGSSFWDGKICWSVLSLDGPSIDPIIPIGVYTNCDECFLSNNLGASIQFCPPLKVPREYLWVPGYTICQKGVYEYNGVCFNVGEVRQIGNTELGTRITFPEPPTFIDPLDCEVCNNSGYSYTYTVTDCLTNESYLLGSNISFGAKKTYVSYFLSNDPLTQRCGFVNPEALNIPPVLGGIISVISDCETCLSQTNKKVELINCIDGSVEVAWASTFFNIDDITYVDFAIPGREGLAELKCCYSIGEETESDITLPVILSYNLSNTCQKCVECNGVYYLWEDCGQPEITGFSLSYQYMTINQTFISPDNNGSCKKVIGTFSGITGNLLAGRLTGNEFTTQPNPLDQNVRYFLEQPDGKFIIGGSFTQFGLNLTNRIVRVNSDGSYDNTFIGGFDGTVISIDQQSDGKIIVVGTFSNYDNGLVISASTYIARLETDGSLDTTFLPTANGGGFDNTVQSVEVQPDGKVLVGGWFNSYNDGSVNPAYRLIRLNTDGSVDLTFNVGSGFLNITEGDDGRVFKTKTQIDGKIIVVGQFDTYDGLPAKGIIRLNSDGSRDNTFNVGSGFDGNPLDGYGYYLARWINLYSDGRILISGHFESYDGQPANKLIRLNSDGSIDNSFSSLVFGPALLDDRTIQTEIQTDGKIITGGFFDTYNTENYPKLIRLNSTGTIDESFYIGDGFNDYVLSLLITSDNKLLVGGQFATYDNQLQNRITQLTLTPQFDTIYSSPTFDGCETCITNTLSINAGSVYPSALNGSIDDIALSLREQPDGKLLIGGWYGDYNGDTVEYLFRVNTDGSLDNTFTNISLLNDAPSAIELQPDGKMLVGGWFNSYNSQPLVNGFARLNSDGTLDTSFLANTGFTINGQNYANNAIKLQPDGKILVGGGFYNYNNNEIKGIIRFNSDGSVDNTFNSGEGIERDFDPLSSLTTKYNNYEFNYETGCIAENVNKFFNASGEKITVIDLTSPYYINESFDSPAEYPNKIIYSKNNGILCIINCYSVVTVDVNTYNTLTRNTYSNRNFCYTNAGVTDDNDYLYLFDGNNSVMVVIDILTNTEITTVPVIGGNVYGMVFNNINNKVYYSNFSDNIYSIDTITNTASTTINSVLNGFAQMTFDSTNNRIYVNKFYSSPAQVFIIDCVTETYTGAVTLPTTNLGKLAFDSVNNYVYVANTDLVVIDTSTNTIIDTQLNLGSNTNGSFIYDTTNSLLFVDSTFVYDPVIEKNYVSSLRLQSFRSVENLSNGLLYIIKNQLYSNISTNNCIYLFDLNTNNIVGSVNTPETATDITYDPVTELIWFTTQVGVYVLNPITYVITLIYSEPLSIYQSILYNNGFIYVCDSGNSKVLKINSPLELFVSFISNGTVAWGITLDTVNDRIYVTNQGSNDISVIDLNTFTVTNTLSVGTNPQGIIYNQIDDTIYVNNISDSTFSYINASTLTVDGTFAAVATVTDLIIDYSGYLVTSSDSGMLSYYNTTTKSHVSNLGGWGEKSSVIMVQQDTYFLTNNYIIKIYPFMSGRIYSINLQNDGSILLGGWFQNYSGQSNNNIVKVLSSGTIDPSFNSGSGFGPSSGGPLPGSVRNILKQPDGKFICTGHFRFYDGNSYNRIIRLNSDGTIDGTFVIGSGFNDRVISSILQSDGKIICVGEFTEYDGTPANRIVRLNSDGSIDTAFIYGDGFDGLARTLLLMSDNTLLVSGYFDNYDNQLSTDYLVRLALEPTESEYTWYEFTPCYGPSGYISLDSTFNPSGENVIIKANYGTVGLVCGVVGDVLFEIPEIGEMYTATDYTEYQSCDECSEGTVYGVTIRNCETGILSEYNMTPQSVFGVVVNGPIFKLANSTSCYQLISSCVIPNDSETIYPSLAYRNCPECLSPVSAGTEYTVCVICCSCEGESSITQVKPPHPVWTDGYGQAITQMGSVTLGGMFGLNN